LSVLTKAGLITPHRVGQWTFYKRDEEAIAAFIASLSGL
jgi:ArsR family transcriptional regulator